MVVVLVGFMGAGKTTVGHIMAERLGLPFVDSDVLIETPPGSSSVFVTPVGGTYYAHIGPGLTGHAGRLLPPLPEVERALIVEASEDARTAAVIADQLAGAGIPAHRVALSDTGAAKTFGAVEQVADVLADHALHKDDLIVAVGGEAICDLAGFVAATFNRGMKLGLVPTTLAAQADSAVGGKNAINLGRGRNLVGTIHQPVVVISDIEVACDNAERGFRGGLAEIAKHALISPSDLRGHLTGELEPVIKRDPAAVQRATTRSIEIKADIVSRDEREQGDRVVLNYGHTFAHAIEL